MLKALSVAILWVGLSCHDNSQCATGGNLRTLRDALATAAVALALAGAHAAAGGDGA